jgi:hypothetical protein
MLSYVTAKSQKFYKFGVAAVRGDARRGVLPVFYTLSITPPGSAGYSQS